MKVELVTDGLGNILGSAVIVAFGLLVLLPRPRTRAQWSFAAFALGIGLGTAASNLQFSDPAWPTDLMWAMVGLGHLVALGGLVGFVGATIGRPTGRSWLLLASSLILLVGVMTLGYWDPSQFFAANAAVGLPGTQAMVPAIFVAIVFFAAAWTAALALARWARHQPPDDRVRAAILSSALVVYPAALGAYGTGKAYLLWNALGVGTMVAAAAVCAAWLVTARSGSGRRAAILAALLPPLAVTVAMLFSAEGVRWTAGASRILTSGLVAFAILRYHALGIHAKLRFGISKSAVAAVFIGVFFAASELAQQFFGEQTGNAYYGIAAAGLLVVAIAPVQRLADRMATKAIPIQDAVGMDRREQVYLDNLRYALSDRSISPDEDLHLGRLADELGIGAAKAIELRRAALGSPRKRPVRPKA